MTASNLQELIGGDPLSDIELDVLLGAANGESAKQTADRIHYTWEYVKTIRKNGIAKLYARNIVNAVAIALSMGIINPDQIELPEFFQE